MASEDVEDEASQLRVVDVEGKDVFLGSLEMNGDESFRSAIGEKLVKNSLVHACLEDETIASRNHPPKT